MKPKTITHCPNCDNGQLKRNLKERRNLIQRDVVYECDNDRCNYASYVCVEWTGKTYVKGAIPAYCPVGNVGTITKEEVKENYN